MNATPTGGDTEPFRDGTASRESGAPDAVASFPAPRSGPDPLPRRTRPEHATPEGPTGEPSHDPDGRPFNQIDELTLSRLLSGLRDI
jgi:hypothetical protein